MAQLTIDYDENQGKIIIYAANKRGITPKEYVERLLANHCTGLIRGFFINKINDKTIEELIVLLGDIQ